MEEFEYTKRLLLNEVHRMAKEKKLTIPGSAAPHSLVKLFVI